MKKFNSFSDLSILKFEDKKETVKEYKTKKVRYYINPRTKQLVTERY